MNEQKTLTVDHLRAWVRHCEEQGDETVVGETMSSTHCLGASALKHIYQTQEVFVGSSNTRTWVGDEAIGIDAAAALILPSFWTHLTS